MRNTFLSARLKGFTLIELLIVVAIIAILAAIAVPNFLEAQLRAKVGRTKSDMRTVSIAIESYAVDNSKYPYLTGYASAGVPLANLNRGGIIMATCLSTPIAYLTTTVMPDPFVKVKSIDAYGETDAASAPGPYTNGAESYTYHYVNMVACRKDYAKVAMDERPKYMLISYGPDYLKGPFPAYIGANIGRNDAWLADYATVPEKLVPGFQFADWQYDPSNGTISGGDIIRRP